MFKLLKRFISKKEYKSLVEIEKKFNFKFSEGSKEIENEVLEIYNGNIDLEKISKNDRLLFILGYYYKIVKKDYELMKKYYLMAIELGNNKAMNNLGIYYKKIKKDYESAVKYYLMAIELGNNKAMSNLAIYYKEIEKDYELAKKYYLMAIENGYDVGKIKGFDNLETHYVLDINSNDREVLLFKNRCNMECKKAKCIVCLDETDCIPFECCHRTCKGCYVRTRKELKECPMCKISFNINM